LFASWGRFVYHHRLSTLLFSFLLLALSLYGLLTGGTLTSATPLTSNLDSFKASNLITSDLGAPKVTSTFDLLFSSPHMNASDPAFQSAVTTALAPISSDPRIAQILSPYTATNPALAQTLISKDSHSALILIDLKASGQSAWPIYNDLRAKVHSPTLSIVGTGFVPINQAFNLTLESDLMRAETITLPVTLLLLLLIFASVVAAGLPLGVGILTILGGLAGTYFLNHFTDMSMYALNIVTLIGLGVSIDYSLFVVNRFRDELAKGLDREAALVLTMAAAGRAITFSGLTVAVGLSALLFFQGTVMASMGAAGAIVVALAVLYGLTFLPALLAFLGPNVNRLRLPSFKRSNGRGFWSTLAHQVMRHPLFVLLPTVFFLVLASTPFLSLRLANGSVDVLPARLEARSGYDTLVADFPGQDQTTYQIVVNYPAGSPLTPARIADQYAFDRRLANLKGVLHVTSIYDLDPSLTLSDYQTLYTGDPSKIPAPARQLFATSVGHHVVVFSASTNATVSSDAARSLLSALRQDPGVSNGGQVLVGGPTAIDVDVINFILSRVPLAVIVVVLATYFLLFLLTGSLVLPLKAVILNFLSIGASFGALVFIFQQGHFASLLGFTPQSLDPTTPVLLFAIVFGLSMDYEVLLVSRIHEEYLRSGDNTQSVAAGLQKTGRLITGAAAIMFTVFAAFGLSEVVIIKAIGVGLAIAVALDATLVRSLVVPAVMRLLGKWNWYSPAPLVRLYQRLGLSDLGVPSPPSPL
jgi:putative drug exporter of the RND superfamily